MPNRRNKQENGKNGKFPKGNPQKRYIFLKNKFLNIWPRADTTVQKRPETYFLHKTYAETYAVYIYAANYCLPRDVRWGLRHWFVLGARLA